MHLVDDFLAVRPPAQNLRLDLDDIDLAATLTLPPCARGLIVLARTGESGSSGAFDGEITRALRRARLGTLRVDLLADGEAARRLRSVARWAAMEAGPGPLPIGYVGDGAAGAAVLMAAAAEPRLVSAVVSYAGRPDLAARWVGRVEVPTLFIVDDVGRGRGRRLVEQAAARAASAWLAGHVGARAPSPRARPAAPCVATPLQKAES